MTMTTKLCVICPLLVALFSISEHSTVTGATIPSKNKNIRGSSKVQANKIVELSTIDNGETDERIKRNRALKGSKKGKNTLVAEIAKYPDYDGENNPSGTVTVKFNDDDSFLFVVNLAGVEPDCMTCGVHIHTGTVCDDASLVGGHYWDASETEDLWTEADGAIYESSSSALSNSAFTLFSGYDYDENIGHAVVIHNSTGSRIGCGILEEPPKKLEPLEATIDTYPGYGGLLTPSGHVTVTFDCDDDTFELEYELEGLAINCTDCGIHIHTGTYSCDDASLVGGHYWDDRITGDLWTTAGGAVYNSNEYGEASGSFYLYDGRNYAANKYHAVTVHTQDGSRIGCGILY